MARGTSLTEYATNASSLYITRPSLASESYPRLERHHSSARPMGRSSKLAAAHSLRARAFALAAERMAAVAAASVSQDNDARIELTWRSLVLGAAITVVFTAANVYLGLKIGLTFATSIPAAVISMAALRALRTGTIFENNIVQTVASAAGTLSSIIFVLPGLVMVGWWTGFPYWESFAICATGGILGVMYSVPLRRALVAQSDLPYPEGVAAAEVLKVGVGSKGETAASIDENKQGLLTLVVSSLVSAGYFVIVQTRIFIDTLQGYTRIGT